MVVASPIKEGSLLQVLENHRRYHRVGKALSAFQELFG